MLFINTNMDRLPRGEKEKSSRKKMVERKVESCGEENLELREVTLNNLDILKRKLSRSPKYRVEKLDIDIPLICRHLDHGDWILYYHLLRNMDSITYAEWLAALTETFRDVEESNVKKNRPEALPLLPQMADRMSTLIM